MTLLDFATYICTMVNQSEASDVAACRSFLGQRFKMIWADQLWKDSLFEYTQTLSSLGYLPTSTWLPTRKTLLLPTAIELPVAVRTDTRKLNVESSESFYRMDYDTFASSGSVTQFRLLKPAVWEFDAAQTLYAACRNTEDNAEVLTVDTLGADGVTFSRAAPALTLAGQSLGLVQRIEAVSKVAGTGPVALTVGIQAAVNFQNTDNVARDFYFAPTQQGAPALSVQNVQPGATAASTISPQAAVQAFMAFTGGQPDFTALVPTPATFVGTIQGDFANGFRFDTTTGLAVVLAATDTAAVRRQRVQLFGTVPEGTVLRVLGKAKAPAFTADADEPSLTGCENALIAFGLADMLKRSRQYGKAAEVAKEGVALLEQLKREQVVQQSHFKRFVPEDGYGWDYTSPLGSPLTF